LNFPPDSSNSTIPNFLFLFNIKFDEVYQRYNPPNRHVPISNHLNFGGFSIWDNFGFWSFFLISILIIGYRKIYSNLLLCVAAPIWAQILGPDKEDGKNRILMWKVVNIFLTGTMSVNSNELNKEAPLCGRRNIKFNKNESTEEKRAQSSWQEQRKGFVFIIILTERNFPKGILSYFSIQFSLCFWELIRRPRHSV